MRRTNTWQDVMTTSEAELDVGDGVKLRIPLDGIAGAGLANRVATLETRTTTQSLGTEDLDILKTAGSYGQNTTGNATATRHYPEQSRGLLVVESVSGEATVLQRYTASFTQNVYVREHYASSWGPWKTQTPGSFGWLTTEDLDAFKFSGKYNQNSAGNATTARHYPAESRGVLEVVQISATSTVAQVFYATTLGEIHMREYYASAWGPWTKIGGNPVAPSTDVTTVQELRTVVLASDYRPDAWATPDGTVTYWMGPSTTERIPSTYRGGGYVGKLAPYTGYTSMQVKKMQSNNEVEVSCLNPTTGTHITHRVQGPGPLNYQDDQRRFEEAWIGSYTGTTVSKDLLIMPRSNIEWAVQINVGGNTQFAPYHGSTSASMVEYGPATVTDGNGAPIDIGAMATNQVLTGVSGFKVRQRLYIVHPNLPGVRFASVDEVHTIAPDGMIQSEAVITFLRDTKIGSNYAPMTAVDQATFGKMKVMDGATYTIKTVPPASTEYLTVIEGHNTKSAYFWSTTNTGAFVAVNFLDRPATFLIGHPMEDTSETAMRIEQRSSAGLTKLYPQPLASGSVILAGTVWRPSAQWRYGQTINAAQHA